MELLHLRRRGDGRYPDGVDSAGEAPDVRAQNVEELSVVSRPGEEYEAFGELVTFLLLAGPHVTHCRGTQQESPEAPVDMHQRTFMKTGSLGSGGGSDPSWINSQMMPARAVAPAT